MEVNLKFVRNAKNANDFNKAIDICILRGEQT